jgi:two-component system sensor histidine kinase PilS (NtrC family)
MLREGLKMDEVNSRLMEIILREISRLNHLVNDFLLFTRPKKPELKEFDLIQLIYDSLELFKNSDRWNQNVQLHVELDGPIPLKSDPEQLKQVLWNLFLNATEAMPNGGQLHVSAGKEDGSEDESIRMCVRDTGLGFSPNALSHLFTPFFTTKDGGSGLGLAIVKRIVEELKGTVNGKNHPDGGAEITIRLRGGTEG